MNAEESAKFHREYDDDVGEMARALLTAIHALETYAQFHPNGEMTIVSGMLAIKALAKIRGEGK